LQVQVYKSQDIQKLIWVLKLEGVV